MHIILAFPFQSFCKQQFHASLEGNSALRHPGRALARALLWVVLGCLTVCVLLVAYLLPVDADGLHRLW
jgi:hypothetical protein